ncbi:hypothetical protein O53_73 [Microcystis aeruginosa TAIHU98]|uniref:Uncharacterized protein n=2 Tax=Microcystis aeruginosa TaxID=1126 RepID=L7E9B4_MICAE|nr:hypothetical protein BH695_1454 [Microcystis aeruginosa PCC 7806SL]ELP55476.1 hypothetical protein O53_73 [Microcystis aeruginosa TAIHU98]ELS49520.1 hypothetical protein C789_646 [Microcystis aeruginosa FACHB-905 = DIANCHI905]ODV39805.1 hypothetical protein BFG60_0664 [Microcystis aeruginosa NIES-98]
MISIFSEFSSIKLNHRFFTVMIIYNFWIGSINWRQNQ